MFTPTMSANIRRLPVAERIRRCRERIEKAEHELAKERRLLSLLFTEERLATPPEEPVLVSKAMSPKFTQKEQESIELLAECRETGKTFGLDGVISERWDQYMRECRAKGIYVDVTIKCDFWLQQLQSFKK